MNKYNDIKSLMVALHSGKKLVNTGWSRGVKPYIKLVDGKILYFSTNFPDGNLANACFEYSGDWIELEPEKTELTIADIEEQLGYSIKVVK